MKKPILRGAKFLGESLERNVSLVALSIICAVLLRAGVTLGAYELIALLFVPVVALTYMIRFIILIIMTDEKAVTTWAKTSKTN